MATVTEQYGSRIFPGTMQFIVECDSLAEDPREVVSRPGLGGVTPGQRHPWDNNLFAVDARIIPPQLGNLLYQVEVVFDTAIGIASPEWNVAFSGVLTTKNVKSVPRLDARGNPMFDRDGNRIVNPIGPRSYIKVEDYEALQRKDLAPSQVSTSKRYQATFKSGGVPKTVWLYRYGGDPDREIKGIDIPVAARGMRFSTFVREISDRNRVQLEEYQAKLNDGEFYGYPRGTVMVARVDIQSGPGVIEGLASRGRVTEVLIDCIVDPDGFQPIDVHDTLRSDDGTEAFIIDELGTPQTTEYRFARYADLYAMLDMIIRPRAVVGRIQGDTRRSLGR